MRKAAILIAAFFLASSTRGATPHLVGSVDPERAIAKVLYENWPLVICTVTAWCSTCIAGQLDDFGRR